MPRHYEAYRRVLEPRGIRVGRREVYLNEGQRSHEIILGLAAHAGVRLEPDDVSAIAEEKQRVFQSFGRAAPYPGADELVTDLHAAGYKLALVTGTRTANLRFHLDEAFLSRFDAIVAAEDVKQAKPYPEPYLAAMRKLGAEASRTLVVENAPLGVKAGKAAGAVVAAVTTTVSKEDLKAADVVLPAIEGVRRILSGDLA